MLKRVIFAPEKKELRARILHPPQHRNKLGRVTVFAAEDSQSAPAIGLIGLMSLALGVGLRVFNRRLRVCNAQRSRPTPDGVGREWVSI
jgi:hypothetical protein